MLQEENSMKRRLSVFLAALLMLSFSAAAFAAEIPQISEDLFLCAKQALVYLSSGEYERLVTLLPFSGIAPSAAEWQNFAEGNFMTLADGVQTEYSVAYWTGSAWMLAVPVVNPDSDATETLVLSSDDGITFSGYRYSTWAEVKGEYLFASYVTWNKEYLGTFPIIAAD